MPSFPSDRRGSMMKNLSEDDWQVLYCIEARFPGFHRKVQDSYWKHLEQTKKFPPSLAERARHLDQAFDLDLTIAADDGPHIPETTAKWLEEVDEYYDDLGSMSSSDLYEEFRKALLGHDYPGKYKNPREIASNDQYAAMMLRYAYWDANDAIEFLSYKNDDAVTDESRKRVREAFSNKEISSPSKPKDFIDFARENKFPEQPSIEELEELDGHSLDYFIGKRKRTLYLLLLAMAIEKFGYGMEGNNSGATRLETLMRNADLAMTSETIRNSLRFAAEGLDEDEVEKLKANLPISLDK